MWFELLFRVHLLNSDDQPHVLLPPWQELGLLLLRMSLDFVLQQCLESQLALMSRYVLIYKFRLRACRQFQCMGSSRSELDSADKGFETELISALAKFPPCAPIKRRLESNISRAAMKEQMITATSLWA